MASVIAGGRVTVQGTRRAVVMRALRAAELTSGWSVPVLVDAAALAEAGVGSRPCPAEVTTDNGPVRLDATLERVDGSLLLSDPSLAVAALTEQRREDVRASVALQLRGRLLQGGYAGPHPPAGNDRSGQADRADLSGRTSSISGGGISAAVTGLLPVAGSRVYLELALPNGELAPAVLGVVDAASGQFRGRFVDISPRDRERLVRLVFARQRVDLAARRRRLGPR